MGQELKEEFKDFIEELSEGICNEVLMGDLNKISKSFNETTEKYERIAEVYSSNVDEIKKYAGDINYFQQELQEVRNELKINNEMINKALLKLEKQNEDALVNICRCYQDMCTKYAEETFKISQGERNSLLTDISNLFDEQNDETLESTIDMIKSEFQESNKNIANISYKTTTTYNKIRDIDTDLGNIKKDNLSLFNKLNNYKIIGVSLIIFNIILLAICIKVLTKI